MIPRLSSSRPNCSTSAAPSGGRGDPPRRGGRHAEESGKSARMSDFVIFLIDAAVKSALIIAILLTGFAYTTLLERRFIAAIQQRIGPNRAGQLGLLQPVADGIKLFFKEDLIPASADKVIFTLAPAITAVDRKSAC